MFLCTMKTKTKALLLGLMMTANSFAQGVIDVHSHLITPYKQGTLHMVKDLKLPTMNPLDPETMKLIFKKQR